MPLTCASSSATRNVQMENKTIPLPMSPLDRQRLFLRKRRSGSQRRKLSFRSKCNLSSRERRVSTELDSKSPLNTDPSLACFLRYFYDLALNQNIIILLFCRKTLGTGEAQDFSFPNVMFVLNSWSCSAATRQGRPIQPRLALMPHPTQCEMRGSGSEWMGKLERCMGTASARAVGGSPLTMLWLLLCTINRC